MLQDGTFGQSAFSIQSFYKEQLGFLNPLQGFAENVIGLLRPNDIPQTN